MKLLSCHIENFGILSDFSYEFKSSLNVFHEENGFGKTTFMTFIKAMFYGLKPKERKQFFPWQGGSFGGSLTFNFESEVLTISRMFGTTEDKDVVTLTSKNGETLKSGQLGAKIFGLNADVFERTAYLMERGDTAAYDKVKNNLSSIIESGEDAKYYDNAITTLLEELSRLEGKKGEVLLLNAQLNKVEAKIADAEAVERQFIENSAILESTDAEIAEKKQAVIAAEKSKIEFYEQNAFLSAVKAYAAMIERVEEKEELLAKQLRFFNGNVIDENEPDEYFRLNDEIKELEYELKTIRREKEKEESSAVKVLNMAASGEDKVSFRVENETYASRPEDTNRTAFAKVKVLNMAASGEDKVSFKVENEKYDESISGEQLRKNQATKNRLTIIQQNRFIPKYKQETDSEQLYAPVKKVTPEEALERVSPDLRRRYAESVDQPVRSDKRVEPPTVHPDVVKLKRNIIARQKTVNTTLTIEEGAKNTRPNWLIGVPHPGLVGKTAVSKIDEGTLKLRKDNFALHSSVSGIKSLIKYFAFGLFGTIALSILFSILTFINVVSATFTIALLSVFAFTSALILAIFLVLIFEIKKKKAEIVITEEKIKKIAGEITKNYETLSKADAVKNLEYFLESNKKEDKTPVVIAKSTFIPQPLVDSSEVDENIIDISRNDSNAFSSFAANENIVATSYNAQSLTSETEIDDTIATKNTVLPEQLMATTNIREMTAREAAESADESNDETADFNKLIESSFQPKKPNTADVLLRLSALSRAGANSYKKDVVHTTDYTTLHTFEKKTDFPITLAERQEIVTGKSPIATMDNIASNDKTESLYEIAACVGGATVADVAADDVAVVADVATFDGGAVVADVAACDGGAVVADVAACDGGSVVAEVSACDDVAACDGVAVVTDVAAFDGGAVVTDVAADGGAVVADVTAYGDVAACVFGEENNDLEAFEVGIAGENSCNNTAEMACGTNADSATEMDNLTSGDDAVSLAENYSENTSSFDGLDDTNFTNSESADSGKLEVDKISEHEFAALEAQKKAFNDELILKQEKEDEKRALRLLELATKEANILEEIEKKKARLNLFTDRFVFADKKPKNDAQILAEVVAHLNQFNALSHDVDTLNRSAEKFRIEEGITTADLEKTTQGEEREHELDLLLENAKNELDLSTSKKAVAADFVKKYFKKPPQLEKFRLEKSHLDFEISKRRERASEIKAAAAGLKEAKAALLAKHMPKAKEEFTALVTSMIDFEDIVLDEALNIKILDKGALRELSSYSEGFKTIFDFCRRVALSKLVFSQTDGFLIMDDPFVMLDEKHFAEATDVLNSLSSTTQIIYFTCHKTRAI